MGKTHKKPPCQAGLAARYPTQAQSPVAPGSRATAQIESRSVLNLRPRRYDSSTSIGFQPVFIHTIERCFIPAHKLCIKLRVETLGWAVFSSPFGFAAKDRDSLSSRHSGLTRALQKELLSAKDGSQELTRSGNC